MIKNCVNCGAPLHGLKCDYCGTEYAENGNILAMFEEGNAYGTIEVGSKKYNCYISKMEAHTIFGPRTGRDMTGRLIVDRTALKHKFTLIEI